MTSLEFSPHGVIGADTLLNGDREVCVLGLGYVGLTLAAVMADVGFKVCGLEIRKQVLDLLEHGKPHFHEPGLENMLRRAIAKGKFRFAQKMQPDWTPSVYIITVGTPLDGTRKPRVDMIENASREVATKINRGDMVILRSTVTLGTTCQVVKPILDAACTDYDLAFCPERTLEGRALEEIRHLPQVVGGQTRRASVRAAQLFQFLTSTVVSVPDCETAEMIKLVDNTSRDVQFAFANEVAAACDKAGISAIEVIRAGKLGYPRTNLPRPGPVGGPCLEKDSYLLADGLKQWDVIPEISLCARRINEAQPTEAVRFIEKAARAVGGLCKTPRICLLGLAFKGHPPTDDMRGTMAKPILNALREVFPQGVFVGFDPVVSPDAIREFGLEPVATVYEAFLNASIMVICNNHPTLASLPLSELSSPMARPAIIYDFWSSYRAEELELPESVFYGGLGSHGRSPLWRMVRDNSA